MEKITNIHLLKIDNLIKEGDKHSADIDFGSIGYQALEPILEYLCEVEERLVRMNNNMYKILGAL